MADVDHYAKPIHFPDHLDAEFTQTVPLFVFVIRRIGNVVGQSMRERDVADTTIEKMLQVGKITFNR